MRLPDESIDDLNHESRAWELLAPWDVHPGNARLERHAVYTFQARAAAKWQIGRIFLAGDAAHQMPPFAGQGMCAGLRDAANLAWKLDLVLQGRAAPGLLSTYDQERRPSANAAIDFSMELGKVICVPDPKEAAARDEAMAAAYDGGPERRTEPARDHQRPRRGRFPARRRAVPAGRARRAWFDDVHGVGWRLVTVDSDSSGLDPALVGWFETIGGVVIDVTGAAADLVAWFEAHDVRWALQRPDFYLFGTAPDLQGAAPLLADLRGQLVGPAPDREGRIT